MLRRIVVFAPFRRHVETFGAVPTLVALFGYPIAVAEDPRTTSLYFLSDLGIVDLGNENTSVLHDKDAFAFVSGADGRNCWEDSSVVDDEQALFGLALGILLLELIRAWGTRPADLWKAFLSEMQHRLFHIRQPRRRPND